MDMSKDKEGEDDGSEDEDGSGSEEDESGDEESDESQMAALPSQGEMRQDLI
jgi:hypothetical protein